MHIQAKHLGILAKLIFLVRLPVPQQEWFLDTAIQDLGEAGLANPSLHEYLLGGGGSCIVLTEGVGGERSPKKLLSYSTQLLIFLFFLSPL